MTYKFKQKIIRMQLSTYNLIRYTFKAKRGESMADYFQRVAKHLEDPKNSVQTIPAIILNKTGGKRK